MEELDEGTLSIAVRLAEEPDLFEVGIVRPGTADAAVTATVRLDARGILSRREELQRAILASSLRTRQVLSSQERSVREVGQELFDALLGSPEVAALYAASSAGGETNGSGFRISLGLSDSLTASLPWETMYDAAAGAYICRRSQLLRLLPGVFASPPMSVQSPLRILGLASSPRGLPALDVHKEKDLLRAALDEPIRAGLVELRWVEPTWSALHQALLSGPWHAVHFSGHGDFDLDRDLGMLVLQDETGDPHRVTADRFLDLLREARPAPRLVVLNACSGAVASPDDLFSSTAAVMVRGGISAVVAMQFEITDPAALAFARGFYDAVARGRTVDAALLSGRLDILGLNNDTLEWITPVLHVHGLNTRVFEIDPVRTATPDAPPSGATPEDRPSVEGAPTGPQTTDGTAPDEPSTEYDLPVRIAGRQTTVYVVEGDGEQVLRPRNISIALSRTPAALDPTLVAERDQEAVELERPRDSTAGVRPWNSDSMVALDGYSVSRIAAQEDPMIALRTLEANYATFTATVLSLGSDKPVRRADEPDAGSQTTLRTMFGLDTPAGAAAAVRTPIAQLANGIGVALLAFTQDDRVLLSRRKRESRARPGQTDVSVVEGMHSTKDLLRPGVLNIYGTCVRGCREELGVAVSESDVELLAFGVDMRFYQWNFMGLVRLPYTAARVIDLHPLHASDRWEQNLEAVPADPKIVLERLSRRGIWDIALVTAYYALSKVFGASRVQEAAEQVLR